MSLRARFQGKIVIVTGAAQGIGRGVAIAVAAEGGAVLAVDRSELVRDVVAEIRAREALPRRTKRISRRSPGRSEWWTTR